jgi:hypothetical protein
LADLVKIKRGNAEAIKLSNVDFAKDEKIRAGKFTNQLKHVVEFLPTRTVTENSYSIR